MSVPYFGTEFTFTQPDGSQFKVKGFGNQDQAVFETLDGYTVVRDPVTGFYQYASLSDDGNDLVPTGYEAESVNPKKLRLKPKLRSKRPIPPTVQPMSSGLATTKRRWETRREVARMRKRARAMSPESVVLAPPQEDKVGEFVGLCLLIEFPDVPGTISPEEVTAYCNQPGYNGFGNKGSVRDYFLENSNDRLDYTNLVTPYYTAKHNRQHYTDPSQPYPRRAQELLREALEWLRTQELDLSSLSVDSENFVYATNVFYAGGLVNNWMFGLWPHFSRISGDFELVPGKIIADYQITNMGNELTLATFCHENGHMICDFPDLYDYRADGQYSHGVGSFCLMCTGGNVNLKNPTQVGAYLKFRAGWANSVTEITNGLHEAARAGTNDFFIRRKNEQEYYIIENRQKTGRDAALPGSGLAIWHIDELGNNEFQNMTPEKHYECSLVQADGEFDLERGEPGGVFGEGKDLYHGQGASQFGDATVPNSRWWDTTRSGLNITNISDNGPVMSFTAND